MNYHIIYNATAYGYSFSYVWVFAVIIAGFVLLARIFLKTLKGGDQSSIVLCMIGFIILLIFTLIFSDGFVMNYTYSKALREGRYHIVEGKVIELTPKPIFGRGAGVFRVAGQRFVYWDNALAGALQTTMSGFGPVSVGSMLRVSYMQDHNGEIHILQVELQQQKEQHDLLPGTPMAAPTFVPWSTWPH